MLSQYNYIDLMYIYKLEGYNVYTIYVDVLGVVDIHEVVEDHMDTEGDVGIEVVDMVEEDEGLDEDVLLDVLEEVDLEHQHELRWWKLV